MKKFKHLNKLSGGALGIFVINIIALVIIPTITVACSEDKAGNIYIGGKPNDADINPFKIKFLFKQDCCSVYSFQDEGTIHYFCTREGSIESQHQVGINQTKHETTETFNK